jgi:hypothetical protein
VTVAEIDPSEEAGARRIEGSTATGQRLFGAVAVAITALVVTLLGLRLRYGVDLLDESYYAAVSYRFALGMRPLLDDLSVHQFASFLVAPVVRAWLWLNGDLNGIILGLRVVYFAVALAAAAVAFVFLRKVTDWRIALISSACSLGLVPYLWFAPSYNTITMLSISLATSLVGIALLKGSPPWMLVLSGMALGSTTIAYPSQGLTVAVALVLLGMLSRSWKASAYAASGVALVGLVLLVTVRAALPGVWDVLAYNRYSSPLAGYLNVGPRIPILVRGFIGATYLAPATYLLLTMAGFRFLRRRVPTILLVALPVVVLMAIHVDYGGLRTLNAATLLLLAVLVSGLGHVGSSERAALKFALAVGLSAGAVFAISSNTGFTAFGIGAAAVGAPAMAVLLINAREAFGRRLAPERAIGATIALGSVCALIILALCWSVAVRDGGYPWRLQQPATGPYAGLFTTPTVAAGIVKRSEDFALVTSASDRIYVYDAEPALHLFSRARPVAPFMFLGSEGGSLPLSRYVISWLERAEHRPTVVVVNAYGWTHRTSLPADHLMDHIAEKYTPIMVTADYVVLRPK